MMNMFRKKSLKFDGTNYDSWKDKMNNNLWCMGPRYWLATKVSKDIAEEDDLESCTREQRKLFMCNIRAREAMLWDLLENEYSQVKLFKTCHEIWKALEANYEGDTHVKRAGLHNLICAFQDAKMMEDESMRNYVGRISEIVARIQSHGGTKLED